MATMLIKRLLTATGPSAGNDCPSPTLTKARGVQIAVKAKMETFFALTFIEDLKNTTKSKMRDNCQKDKEKKMFSLLASWAEPQ